MATATSTATPAQAGAPIRYVHEGVVSVHGTGTIPVSSTAGDVLQLCKIPNGAEIIGGRVGVIPSGSYIFTVGLDNNGTYTAATPSLTASATIVHDLADSYGVVGLEVSITGGATNQYSTLQLVTDTPGSTTTTTVVKFSVQYTMDGR